MAEISELSAARAAATRTDARVRREQQEQNLQLREQQERGLRLTERRESELDQRVQQDIDIRLAEDQIATAEADTDLPRGSIVDILG